MKLVGRVIGRPHQMLDAFNVMLVTVLLVRHVVPADFLPVRSRKCFGVRLRLPRNTALRHAHVMARHTIRCLVGGPTIRCIRDITKDDPHMKADRTQDRLAIVLGP